MYLAPTPSSPSRESQKSPSKQKPDRELLTAHELATRLSIFLWCSIPDDELLDLANTGRLLERNVLDKQLERMLADSRSQRLAEQFVHQWLDLELLDFLNFKQHLPGFDPQLKEAMQHEPIALFWEMLRNNESVLNFIHADYTMANERLARHYGIGGVHGNHFRRVPLRSEFRRGGLLTQAGLLSMNSDYPDSHPLKRGKWILISLLNDPPPPPPPAVPQIDLTNPEIAKMTLKERIEDHRNQPACYNCHMKIDPWESHLKTMMHLEDGEIKLVRSESMRQANWSIISGWTGWKASSDICLPIGRTSLSAPWCTNWQRSLSVVR